MTIGFPVVESIALRLDSPSWSDGEPLTRFNSSRLGSGCGNTVTTDPIWPWSVGAGFKTGTKGMRTNDGLRRPENMAFL